MQQKEQFFTKLNSLKNTILSVAVGIFIAYAVIGSIILLANNDALEDYMKIIGPLMIFAVAIFVAVDNFHKLNHKDDIVKYLALSSLILGPVCVLLLSLMIWGAIPLYESSSRYMSYYSSGPTIAAKLIFSLTYLVVFAFLGSNALAIKDNNKIVHFTRFATFIFLTFAVIVNIINIFSSGSDIYGYLRMVALSGVTWISCIGLGCVTFFISKVISWEEKEPTIVHQVPSPPAPQTVISPVVDTPPAPVEEPVNTTDYVEAFVMTEEQKVESSDPSAEPQNDNSEETSEAKE